MVLQHRQELQIRHHSAFRDPDSPVMRSVQNPPLHLSKIILIVGI